MAANPLSAMFPNAMSAMASQFYGPGRGVMHHYFPTVINA